MGQLETTAYYAFGGPLYAALVGAEWWVARRHGRSILSFAPSYGNLSAGLGAITVGLFLGPCLVLLYDTAYQNLALVSLDPASPVTWLLAVVLADLGHYLHHRLDHRVAICFAIHGVHHQPEEMNFTVAMRHAWFSDLYSFPFYAMLPLLGVPTLHFFAATTLLSFHALITHSAEYNFPSFGLLVTPRSHTLHHARNPRYIDRNFGAMLCVWDKLFGTHVALDPSDPPEYGTQPPYLTHDGLLAQWVGARDLIDLASRAQSWPDRLAVFFGRPGQSPPGVVPLAYSPARSAIPLAVRAYVAVQFVVIVAFAHWVFLLREVHGIATHLVAATILFSAITSLGGLLDGRKRAWGVEGVRLIGTLWALLWLFGERAG